MELGQTGAPIDRIDLSQMANATGFDRLVITEGNLVLSGDPAPITEIRIQGDTANRAITLYNVSAGQLRAEHFIFADRPGFVGGDASDNTLTGDAGKFKWLNLRLAIPQRKVASNQELAHLRA